MAQTSARDLRSKINHALSERFITDPVLSERLFEIATEYRSLPQSDPDDAWRHPIVRLVKELTGNKVPPAIIKVITSKYADRAPADVERCVIAWNMRGYNPQGYGWLEWLDSGIPEREIRTNATKPNAGRSGARVHGPVRGGDQGKPAGGSVYSQLITDAAAD